MDVIRTPAVSIIIPVYNRANTVLESVNSVLRQTWTDFELLIVDDGSTDTTREVVSRINDPRVQLLQTPKNMGPSGARNVGIKAARAPWTAFQDSDDEWLPTKLALQMARLQEPQTNWIGAYCGMMILSEPDTADARTTASYLPSPEVSVVEGDVLPSILRANVISTQLLVARTDILRQAGGFDENLPALVDWDLAIRLAALGRFAFVDEPLVVQRFSPNSITHDMVKRSRARAVILDKHADQIASVPGLLARHYRSLSWELRRAGDLPGAARSKHGADPTVSSR